MIPPWPSGSLPDVGEPGSDRPYLPYLPHLPHLPRSVATLPELTGLPGRCARPTETECAVGFRGCAYSGSFPARFVLASRADMST